jgi:hypothetical protein
VADIFDERRRGLEEDYFRRRDKEALDKLRGAIAEEAKARGEDVPTMSCPRCDGKLHLKTYEDVSVDQCDRCHGIWLDAGELEELVGKESTSNRWLRVFWPGRTKE